jgi:hypothetical protein
VLRLPRRLLVPVINQIPGEEGGGRQLCVNVTGHAVTNELGEEIVTAGGGRRKFEGV